MKKIITWATGLKWSTVIVGLLIIGGAFLLFGGKSNEINETLTVERSDFVKQVFVSGNVQATNNVELGFAQSGRISRVYVKVGDFVYSGSVLAEIENGDLRANILQKQAALETEEAKLASLKEGVRSEELAVKESQVVKDEESLLQANQELVNTIRDAYRDADDAVRNQIDQFMSNPRSATPQISFVVSDSNLKNRIESERVVIELALTDWQNDVFALTSNENLTTAQIKARNILSDVAGILADANSALNQGIGTSSDFALWIVDISNARTSINTAISSLTTAVTAQKNAQASLIISKKNLSLTLAGSSQSDINAQAARVKSAEADVVNARAQLLKTLIIAPFSGKVIKVESKVGGVARTDVVQVALISAGGFEIESYVPEVDIADIKIDDLASVTLDAYGEEVIFDAKIASIEPAETVRDGVSTYKTILNFMNQDERIFSGMTANVIITTEQKKDVISIPQRIVETKADGTRIVQVKEDGVVSDREVVTGKVSSLGQIEIISGLQVGDVVVLTESK